MKILLTKNNFMELTMENQNSLQDFVEVEIIEQVEATVEVGCNSVGCP